MKLSLRWTALGLLLCAAGCSTTPTRPADPPRLQALLQPEKVEGRYASIDELRADPTSTPIDTDSQLIATEAALRRANRDQLDAAALLEQQRACGWWDRLRGRCGE